MQFPTWRKPPGTEAAVSGSLATDEISNVGRSPSAGLAEDTPTRIASLVTARTSRRSAQRSQRIRTTPVTRTRCSM